jgi:hypothetical protein
MDSQLDLNLLGEAESASGRIMHEFTEQASSFELLA